MLINAAYVMFVLVGLQALLMLVEWKRIEQINKSRLAARIQAFVIRSTLVIAIATGATLGYGFVAHKFAFSDCAAIAASR